jgi:uncharacterized membrane protein
MRMYSVDVVTELVSLCVNVSRQVDRIGLKKNVMHLTFMVPCIVNVFLSTTNEMQRYTIFFIVVSALHVSGGVSAHHQELKNCTCSIGY